MSLAVATEVGYKKIPGADHDKPVYHYRLTPGQAYQIDNEGGHEVVHVDEKTCKAAGYTFTLQWISGRTVALFQRDNVTYAQPITEGPTPKGKKAKSPPPREAGDIYRKAPVAAPEPRTAPPPRGRGPTPPPPRAQPTKKTIKSPVEVAPEEASAPTAPRRVKGQRRLKKPLSLLDF